MRLGNDTEQVNLLRIRKRERDKGGNIKGRGYRENNSLLERMK